MQFDHIGIFAKDLEYGAHELSKIFHICHRSKTFNDHLLRVSVQFCYDDSGICYELVAPFGDNNPVDAVIKNGSRTLNHIAYKTNQFDKEITNLRKAGLVPLGHPQPALAFNNSRVIFFLTPLKLIFELIEYGNQEHRNRA